MIKAIIFDCFGVLAQDGWLKFSEEHFKKPVERSLARDLLKQHDAGILTADQFSRQAAEMTDVSSDMLKEVITTHNTKNDQLLDFIKKLKGAHYKLGILSNVGEDWLGKFLTAEEHDLFDYILLSYKVGLTKPDPLIYMMAAEKLDVPTQECVFIDDRQVCVDGAISVGMKGVRYEDFESFKERLTPILTDPNN